MAATRKKSRKAGKAASETMKIAKGEKLLLYFPDLDDYEELLSIKAKASQVFGEGNVLVVMGNMKATKVQGL